jgi:copper homeostasis protein
MAMKPILEACVESFAEALLAEKNGADRIELCSRLDLDGLTPDVELTKNILENISIPVKVMIRPRGGDFVYSNDEIEEMKEEILRFKTLNVQGFVFGILDSDNHLNLRQIDSLSKLSFPLKVTIHKAIDLCDDPVFETKQLVKISYVTSILTSGGTPTAYEGSENIKKMIAVAGDSISIISAGSITKNNLAEIHQRIGGLEYHGRRIVGEL